MFRNKYFAATDVGLQRDNNEDAYFSSSKLGLWVVADGMGGHAAGEVASSLVIETIQREIRNGSNLVNAIQKSHHDILSAANSGIGGVGMGSTVVALHSVNNQYTISWVGDSRAYLFVPKVEYPNTPELLQLTTDHSYVQMLYQSGAISETELSTHPERNIITQCLGSVELSSVSVDHIVGEWVPNSKILLCSDGLSDVVSDKRMTQILSRYKSNQRATSALIRAALDAGGKDNITLSIVDAPSITQRWLQQMKAKLSKIS